MAHETQRSRMHWVSCALLILPCTASFSQSNCAQHFDDAKALFDNGDRQACITTIDSALRDCGNDRDLKGRLLFLKALAEAGQDSLELMRSDLERLFRTDRHYVIKAYDPLIKGKPGEADLYGAWEQLHRDLRNDMGRWRAGAQLSLVEPMPRATTDRKVFEDDSSLDYSGIAGWGISAQMEWDVYPDWAARANIGYASYGYRANNGATDYRETIKQAPIGLGVKRMFQLRKSPFVPFIALGGGTSWIFQDEAEIARTDGTDTRYLKPLSVDRLSERRQRQYWAEGSIGVSRKAGSTVFSVEAAYVHSFTSITSDDAPWTNTELMSDFYYLDNDVFLDFIEVRASVQYIIRYHRKNRIHP